MKRLLMLVAALVTMVPNGRTQPMLLNYVVAIVNDSVITYKEVLTAALDDMLFLERRYGGQPQVLREKLKQLEEERVESLVERRLVLDDYKKSGYNLPDSLFEEKINRDIRTYGNRLTLMKTLQAKGLTFETYRTRKREDIILAIMSEHFVPHDPVISPNRIDAYYQGNLEKFRLPDQIKLRMISLTNRPNDTAYSPSKLAGEIVAKLNEGAPFAEMAKIYSQDSQAAMGGEVGWKDKAYLRSELSEKAFALKAGARTEPIDIPGVGCYILLVEEAKPSHVRPLSEVRDQIENTLKGEEIKRLHKKWIDRLKQKSFVRYF